jgi:hypothetical protein
VAEFPFTFGLDTFGDVTNDENDRPLSHAQTIRNLVEEGVRAEEVGLDFFGIGEHHTEDFPLSAADVVLAAIAARTSRIHVGSAVTVLSSDDPVRVFQRFSTLNAISSGRAEVILGRGSSIDSFRFSGTTSPTTRSSSRRRPTSSPRSSRVVRSPGKDERDRHCTPRMLCRIWSPDPSRCGSASAAALNRSSAPRRTGSR